MCNTMHIQTVNNVSEIIQIDQSLTLLNCSEKGYQWVKDTIFSPKTPSICRDIVNLIGNGYCLGRPKMATESKVLVGLYKPK